MPKISVFSFYLNILFIIISSVFVIYSMFYKRESVKIQNALGIILPISIQKLLSFNIIFSLIVMILIGFLSILSLFGVPK
ncbi:MAG: hypothetical protein G01um101493_253 [Microgenomates group bacterium Gr01-1014_93]|nr:MAG: hypothetical protein G01um101493_253 [Microgenomates group bacterium Gr01-1014_93]